MCSLALNATKRVILAKVHTRGELGIQVMAKAHERTSEFANETKELF